jgi:hypothetical protein
MVKTAAALLLLRQQNGTLVGCSSPGQPITIDEKKFGRV